MPGATTQSVRRAIDKTLQTVELLAYLNSDQTGLIHNSWNKLNLGKTLFDVGKNYDKTNFKFIAPITGLYVLQATVYFTTLEATKQYLIALYKNGTAYKYSSRHSSVTNDLSAEIYLEVFLKQNDYIELYANPNTAGDGVAAKGTLGYTTLIARLITKEGIKQ